MLFLHQVDDQNAKEKEDMGFFFCFLIVRKEICSRKKMVFLEDHFQMDGKGSVGYMQWGSLNVEY